MARLGPTTTAPPTRARLPRLSPRSRAAFTWCTLTTTRTTCAMRPRSTGSIGRTSESFPTRKAKLLRRLPCSRTRCTWFIWATAQTESGARSSTRWPKRGLRTKSFPITGARLPRHSPCSRAAFTWCTSTTTRTTCAMRPRSTVWIGRISGSFPTRKARQLQPLRRTMMERQTPRFTWFISATAPTISGIPSSATACGAPTGASPTRRARPRRRSRNSWAACTWCTSAIVPTIYGIPGSTRERAACGP